MHARVKRLLRENQEAEPLVGEPEEAEGDDGTPEAEFDEIASGGFDESIRFSMAERNRLRRRVQRLECCGECTQTEGCDEEDDEEDGGGCSECGEQVCFQSEGALLRFLERAVIGEVTEAEKWLQKAIKHPGCCSGDAFGGPDCPKGSPQYNLAKRLKKGGDLYKDIHGGGG